ncbi:MAG TPA: GMC family oxidoreductase [Solirubrobacteraceae bacterium]
MPVIRGEDLPGDTTITVDACVIGTGAGGAPVAKELAEGGMTVAILEEGEWQDTATFTARPREMTGRLYRDAGQIVTIGTPPIVLPLGKAVGGTTLVNSGTCFRTPDHVLARWRSDLGLEQLTPDALAPFFARVEHEIHVSQVTPELAGENADVVRRGAEALGYSGDYLHRNAKGCVGSGVCAFGCPTGAKQHTGASYMPKATAAGATTYTGTHAEHVSIAGGRAREVVARTTAGGRLRVRCTYAIVACGALLTPVFLARQGIRHPQLGENLTIHPAAAARALLDHDIDPWRGVPQSYYVDELAHDGIMLEGISGPPDQQAAATPGSGAVHRERMLNLRRTATFGVMVSDSASGSVHRRLGQTLIRYDLADRDAERFRRGFELLAEIFFAAGAREVLVPIDGEILLRDGDLTPLRTHRTRPQHISAMAFHPLGTARMGADARQAVVDADLQVHGVEGLYVCDGSVVPSSLGVNPQITIMALATRLAFNLTGRPAPRTAPFETA